MSALQKLLRNKFCKKPRPSPPAVIELPTKDEKPREEASVFLGAMPPPYLRLVLFQEEGCERRLLFDSKSFEPQKVQQSCCRENRESPTSNTCDIGRRSPSTNIGRPYQHVYVRGPQDSDVLSEMLFGTVGMASRASSLKIHVMRDPQRLMLSRVFCVESAKETGSLERGLDTQRPTSSRRKAQTLPVPTPTPEPAQPSPMSPYQSLASSLTKMTRSDSSSSLMSLLGASLAATGSLGSRPSSNPIIANKSHSLPPVRQSSRDSFTLTHEPHSGILSRRTKVKIGFAVTFQPEPSDSSEFQRFFFEHFPLVESYVTFLKEQVENALNNFKKGGKAEFFENMMDALNTFTSRIQSIYSTPRLSRPVWPTLISQSSSGFPWNGDDVTMKCFISELARMVTQHNTKQKNFFMTGLVTSTLTHHLGWVNTTMAGSENERESRMMAYNPLWAQLGDLYGAVGTPTKVAKTVVVGEIHEVVSTIISILSYFIRCSAVKEVVKVPSDFSPKAFRNNIASLKMSFVPSDLERSSYVLIDMDEEVTKSVTHDEETNHAIQSDSKLRDSFRKSNHRQKSITSKPIDVAKDQRTVDERGNATSSGSVLCRSRSSPATSTKPHVKFYRQQSGNFEAISPRGRKNSNDAFAKPRSVQSRRTSRNAQQSTSHSASTKSIPDEVSSLDVATVLTPDLHDNDPKPTNQNASNLNNALKAMLPIPRARTHKRVSSEPFAISTLQSEEDAASGLTKTKSTYFQPIRQETFVDSLEPRVINVTHLQRAQPVMAQSPNLTKSTRFLGFKTSEKQHFDIKLGTKHHKSVTAPEKLNLSMKKLANSHVNTQNVDNGVRGLIKIEKLGIEEKLSSKTTPKTAPVESNAPKFDFKQEKGQRSISTNNPVRRNSSGKPKIAARRRNLSDLQNKIADNERPLPPFQRIPSISLEHDEFNQYFPEDEGDSVTTFFVGTDDQSSITCNLSNVNHNHSTITDMPFRRSSRTNSDVTITSARKEENYEKQTTVKSSEIQKAENLSTVTKRAPPPLPSSRPVGRKPPVHPPAVATKSPPPLPTAAPIHKTSLYPNLDETQHNASRRPTDLALPKPSIYPAINPKPNTSKLTTPPSGKLYPNLADCDITMTDKTSTLDEESPAINLSMRMEVPLREVDVQPTMTTKSPDNGDKKVRRLNCGDLIADYSPEYLWGFALHGTRNQPSLYMNVMRELRQSTSIPVLDEQIAEAVTIIADTDRWSVKVLSSHRIHSDKLALPALNSKLVNEILEKIKKLYQMSVPASFCMQQLEQSLGELVMKSKMLADYVCGNTRVKMPQLSAILGIESSDLPLLMAIASCHSPEVGAKLL